MGKRGPPAKPQSLRVFEGNPGNLPLKDEPKPPANSRVPLPPDWLGIHGKAVWEELAPLLYGIGCLTKVDTAALGAYCEAWEEFHTARELIKVEGHICVSDKGGAYQHPAVGIKNKALARIRQIGNDFGLSPSARSGIVAEKPDESDDMDEQRGAI